jgi:hypothetical protein
LEVLAANMTEDRSLSEGVGVVAAVLEVEARGLEEALLAE